jgi:septal ring factor EnvC (AmiA/AmiB activator)
MSVSKTTEDALRNAMRRLLAGTAQHTNGALTKTNLYKEAQVSRATMNRAVEIIAEWDHHVARRDDRPPEQARRDDELDKLAKKLRDTQTERADLRKKLDAAATVIAALYHDNQALREHLSSRTGKIASIEGRRAGNSQRHSPLIGPC